MASYQPPTEDLAIFDSTVFLTGDEPLTYNVAVKKFLKYPNAQGTENLLDTNVNGVFTTNDDVVFSPSTNIQWDRADFNYLINDKLPKTITSGTSNISVGHNCLGAITSGSNNVAIGRGSQAVATSGSSNISMGAFSLNDLTTGGSNVCIGANSGRFLLDGIGNVGIGPGSLNSIVSANSSVAVGSDSLKTTTLGLNVGVGVAALRDSAVCTDCVSVGYQSNMTTTAGTENTALGNYTNNGGFSTSTAIGFRAANTANNQIRLGRATESVSIPGSLTVKLADDNSAGTFYIPFFNTTGGNEGSLSVDSVTGPLTYVPSTGSLKSVIFISSNYNGDNGNGPMAFGGNISGGSINIGNGVTSGTINIGNNNGWNNPTGGITIGNGAFTNPLTVRLMTGAFTSTGVLNLMTGANTGTGTVNIGGSANTTINLSSSTIFSNTISTSNTTAPSASRQLGYTTSKTTGWSNITNAASNLNSITIDGVTIAYGVYRIDVYVNFTNGAAAQDFRIGVSAASATLQAPLCVRSTASGLDDGVVITQTINAYTTTTFYIVAQSSNVAGATLYTSGARNSYIYLTRIG